MSRRGARHPTIPAGRRFLTHGDDQIRTGDPLLAKQVLSQLSYIPKRGISLLEIVIVLAGKPRLSTTRLIKEWAFVESNHRPRGYQPRALTI